MLPADFLAALACTATAQRATVENRLLPLALNQLNQRPAPGSWSILECLEHLNRYCRYYLPQLALALTQSPASAAVVPVRYSWLGRKSVEMMRPENTKKSTTLKRMNPHGSQLSRDTITEFRAHQTQLLALLAQAHTADLNRKAVPVEFFKLLKLRVGEALEFVVVHQQRHLQQALLMG